MLDTETLFSRQVSLQKLESLFRPRCKDDSMNFFIRSTEVGMKDMMEFICPSFKTSCPALKLTNRLVIPETVKRHASSILVPLFDIISKHESLIPCKYCNK